MSEGTCPVCGHTSGACAGNARVNERQIITSEGVITRKGPERVPIIRGRIGKAGYVGLEDGRVQLYDPKVPHIRFVQDVEEEAEDDSTYVINRLESESVGSIVEPVLIEAPKPKRTRKPKDE